MGAVFSANPNSLPVCPTRVWEFSGANPCSAECKVQLGWIFYRNHAFEYIYTHWLWQSELRNVDLLHLFLSWNGHLYITTLEDLELRFIILESERSQGVIMYKMTKTSCLRCRALESHVFSKGRKSEMKKPDCIILYCSLQCLCQ